MPCERTGADYNYIRERVYDINTRFEGARCVSIGATRLKRGIFAIDFGAKKVRPVLIVGGINPCHSEIPGYLLWLAQRLLGEDKNAAALPEKKRIIVVPCLNPDGFDIAANGAEAELYLRRRPAKKLRAADCLERNFAAQSEEETRALCAYIDKIKPRRVIELAAGEPRADAGFLGATGRGRLAFELLKHAAGRELGLGGGGFGQDSLCSWFETAHAKSAVKICWRGLESEQQRERLCEVIKLAFKL